MNRKIFKYLNVLILIILALVIEASFAAGNTQVDIQAILINITPPGESSKNYDPNTGNAKDAGKLGDDLWIKVNQKISPKEARLYLNGIRMQGINAQGVIGTDDSSSWLRFRLERNQENKDAWQTLLARPKNYTKYLVVNIGKNEEIPTGKHAKFEFINVPKVEFWVTTILFVIFLIVFIYLARKTEMIRDRGPKAEENTRRTYSLAFTQMAFWTFVVAASYAFIFMITGDLDTINPSILILIGIGAVTAVSATSMDSNKRKNNEEQRLAEMKKLNELKVKQPLPANEIKEIENRIKRLEKASKILPTEGFLKDILTDLDGVALHRFQMLIWTTILGLIFLVKVYKTLSMPEFGTELLGLMGISSGTYLGFKIPENQENNETN